MNVFFMTGIFKALATTKLTDECTLVSTNSLSSNFGKKIDPLAVHSPSQPINILAEKGTKIEFF